MPLDMEDQLEALANNESLSQDPDQMTEEQLEYSIESTVKEIASTTHTLSSLISLNNHYLGDLSAESYQRYRLAVSSVLHNAGMKRPDFLFAASFESADTTGEKSKSVTAKVIEFLKNLWKTLTENLKKLMDKVTGKRKEVEKKHAEAQTVVKEAAKEDHSHLPKTIGPLPRWVLVNGKVSAAPIHKALSDLKSNAAYKFAMGDGNGAQNSPTREVLIAAFDKFKDEYSLVDKESQCPYHPLELAECEEAVARVAIATLSNFEEVKPLADKASARIRPNLTEEECKQFRDEADRLNLRTSLHRVIGAWIVHLDDLLVDAAMKLDK